MSLAGAVNVSTISLVNLSICTLHPCACFYLFIYAHCIAVGLINALAIECVVSCSGNDTCRWFSSAIAISFMRVCDRWCDCDLSLRAGCRKRSLFHVFSLPCALNAARDVFTSLFLLPFRHKWKSRYCVGCKVTISRVKLFIIMDGRCIAYHVISTAAINNCETIFDFDFRWNSSFLFATESELIVIVLVAPSQRYGLLVLQGIKHK